MSPTPSNSAARPPVPPFTEETARQKVRLAEDAWNSRDPERVSLAYTVDSRWRNRSEFVTGREAIVSFLTRKWARELDYRLIKELWAFREHRIAVRFAYEWHDDSGHWFRSYGNENWEFTPEGLMALRFASINDLPIRESERKYFWPLGRRRTTTPGYPNSGCRDSRLDGVSLVNHHAVMQLPGRIQINPAVMRGKACVKGTRIPVYLLLQKMAAGETVDAILAAYPQLGHDDIAACLDYASQLATEEVVLASA